MTPIDLNPPVTKNETQKSLHTAQLSSNLTEPPGPTATFLPCLVRVSFGDGKTTCRSQRAADPATNNKNCCTVEFPVGLPPARHAADKCMAGQLGPDFVENSDPIFGEFFSQS